MKKKTKLTFNEKLIVILFIMLILLLLVNVFAATRSININNASTASIVFNEMHDELDVKININTATVAELMYLNGIGEAKAKQIIEYRDQHPFDSITELLNVIGIQTYDNIKNAVTIGN